MDPQAVLQRILDGVGLLAALSAASTPDETAAAIDDLDASEGGDLSEIDHASEVLDEWFQKVGYTPTATDEEITQIEQLADDYERLIAPEQYTEGALPKVVAHRLRHIAEELRSALEDEDA